MDLTSIPGVGEKTADALQELDDPERAPTDIGNTLVGTELFRLGELLYHAVEPRRLPGLRVFDSRVRVIDGFPRYGARGIFPFRRWLRHVVLSRIILPVAVSLLLRTASVL